MQKVAEEARLKRLEQETAQKLAAEEVERKRVEEDAAQKAAAIADRKRLELFAAQKAAAKASSASAFVSTNDVLVSHFLCSCRVRMAFMTINYRHPKRWVEIAEGMK